MLHHHHACEH